MTGAGSHQDPYEVLGLHRGASPAEVRDAFRREVVRCHPDSRPDDPTAAMRRFAEVTWAYERIMGGMPRAKSPEDYARMDVSWLLNPLELTEVRPGGLTPSEREDLIRIERPTCDEQALFLLFWALGLALGLAVLGVWVGSRQAVGNVGVGQVLLAGLLCEGIFLGVTIGAYHALVHSRQIVWLVGLLGFWRRPRLPAPVQPLPKTTKDVARLGGDSEHP